MMKSRLDHIILENIILKDNLVEYQFSATGKAALLFTTNKLIIQYPHDLGKGVPPSILAIPFVANILPLAWLTNSILWVKEIDKSFYDGIKAIKSAYQELYPHYNLQGQFVPAIIKNNEFKANASSLLLFTGGVDAQTSFMRNSERVSHLCNIQGWYKQLDDIDGAAEKEFKFVEKFALDNNCNAICIKSNFATLVDTRKFKSIEKRLGISWWFGFNHSMAFISISIPIAYSLGISEIIIASSYTIGHRNVCASYITTDSEFKYAGLGHVLHDGFELNRQNKIASIVSYRNKTHQDIHLRVCSFNETNCGYCDKCFRTILALIAENANPNQFGFDIKTSMIDYLRCIISDRLLYIGVARESATHWKFIKNRMLENYDILKEKEMVDLFLNYDFVNARKRKVREYYIKNFFSILKRKFTSLFK